MWGILAALSFISGFVIWPGFAIAPKPPDIEGGVLVLHDYVEDERGLPLPLQATIEATQWETGVPGVSILALDIQFDRVTEDQRWYVVASGDYNVDPGLPDSLYCPGVSMNRLGDGIECPGNELEAAARYDFDQQLGFNNATPTIDSSITDLDGYDDRAVTVVSGELNATGAIRVELPISTPEIEVVSGNEFVRYGVIGYPNGAFSYGSRNPLDEPCTLIRPITHATARWGPL